MGEAERQRDISSVEEQGRRGSESPNSSDSVDNVGGQAEYVSDKYRGNGDDEGSKGNSQSVGMSTNDPRGEGKTQPADTDDSMAYVVNHKVDQDREGERYGPSLNIEHRKGKKLSFELLFEDQSITIALYRGRDNQFNLVIMSRIDDARAGEGDSITTRIKLAYEDAGDDIQIVENEVLEGIETKHAIAKEQGGVISLIYDTLSASSSEDEVGIAAPNMGTILTMTSDLKGDRAVIKYEKFDKEGWAYMDTIMYIAPNGQEYIGKVEYEQEEEEWIGYIKWEMDQEDIDYIPEGVYFDTETKQYFIDMNEVDSDFITRLFSRLGKGNEEYTREGILNINAVLHIKDLLA